MSRSFDFVKARAGDPSVSGLADRDFSHASEVDAAPIFYAVLNLPRQYDLTGRDINGDKVLFHVELVVDPDADCEFYTHESSTHDGTLVFIHELINQCARKIASLGTWDKRVDQPKYGDTVRVTTGNFLVLNEYADSGKAFGDNIKPWMCMRTTVCLPLKTEIIKGE